MTTTRAALAKLTGADKHDRKRYASESVAIVAPGVGVCPDWMSPEVKVIWNEVSLRELPSGVLTIKDRRALMLLCSVLAEFEAGPLSTARAKFMDGLLQQFGMTPQSGKKVVLLETKKEAVNPFAEFAQTFN